MKIRKVDSDRQFNFEAAAAQRDRLLYELRCGEVSTIYARKLGIMSPAARILELRRKGYKIDTDKCKIFTTDGAITCVALYRLIEEPVQQEKV